MPLISPLMPVPLLEAGTRFIKE